MRKRETPYGEFITEAARLLSDAFDHTLDKPETLVKLYAILGRIRLFSSEAEECSSRILDVYATPNRTVDELMDAALEGARLRLRPILMTSFAFICGCLPLWFASGSGAVARRVLGSTVIGGMLAASGIAIFFIPVTFYVVERLSKRKHASTQAPQPEPQVTPTATVPS
jgi:multidrug efflux pump